MEKGLQGKWTRFTTGTSRHGSFEVCGMCLLTPVMDLIQRALFFIRLSFSLCLCQLNSIYFGRNNNNLYQCECCYITPFIACFLFYFTVLFQQVLLLCFFYFRFHWSQWEGSQAFSAHIQYLFPSAHPIPGAEDFSVAFTGTSLLPASQPPPLQPERSVHSSSSSMLLVNCPKTGRRGVLLCVCEAPLLFLVGWLDNLIFHGEITY